MTWLQPNVRVWLENQVECYIDHPCLSYKFPTGVTAAADSDSEDEVGAQAPKLTKQISNILKRYPEGGQILKVAIKYLAKAHQILNVREDVIVFLLSYPPCTSDYFNIGAQNLAF